jgi:general secretion pathway protein C
MNRTGILVANGALLVLCCFLAAQVVAALAAEVLAPPPEEEPAASRQAEPAQQGTNDSQAILGRNLFKVSTLGPTGPPVDEEEEYAKTKLPLRLLGTAAAADAALSWAAVEDLDTREHLVVRINGQLKGTAQVVRIDRRRIVLQNGPRREELSLEEGDSSPAPRRSARVGRGDQRRRRPEPARGKSLTSNVRKLGENRFSVPRADVESAASNPAALFSQARILPKYEDGEMVGVQLNSIKAGSLFEEIGIQDGDTITQFNGIQVTGQQQSAEVLRELTEAKEFDVSVTGRDGETRRLRYELR